MGMAGGGDVILIPELSYDIHNIGNTIIERLKGQNGEQKSRLRILFCAVILTAL